MDENPTPTLTKLDNKQDWRYHQKVKASLQFIVLKKGKQCHFFMNENMSTT